MLASGGRFSYASAHFIPNPEASHGLGCHRTPTAHRSLPLLCRSIRIATTGRLPVYCSSRCKQRAFRRMHPEWKPNRPKVSPADRQRRLIWGVLQDAGVIPLYKVLPPRREAEER